MKSYRISTWLLLLVAVLCMSAPTACAQKVKIIDKAVFQYAGGLGFVSIGTGRSFFKNQSGELDLLVGYVPKSIANVHIWSVSLKYSHLVRKWAFHPGKYSIYPAGLGLFMNQPIGSQYTKYSNRNQYPRGYYWFNNLPRMGFFWTGRVSRTIQDEKELSLYTEVGTYDLYLFSWSGNRETISMWSILNISFGVKYRFW